MTDSAGSARDEEEVVDPVCGEIFPPGLAVFKSEHEGRRYWFCSKTCKQAFDEDPQKALEAEA